MPVALRSVDRNIDVTKYFPPSKGKRKTKRLHETVELLSNQPRDSSMKAIKTNREGDGIAEPRSVGEKEKKKSLWEFQNCF